MMREAAAMHRYAAEAAYAYGLTKDDVLGRARDAYACAARRHVIRRLHDDGLSLNDIGFLLDRNHTTILHALSHPGRRAA